MRNLVPAILICFGCTGGSKDPIETTVPTVNTPATTTDPPTTTTTTTPSSTTPPQSTTQSGQITDLSMFQDIEGGECRGVPLAAYSFGAGTAETIASNIGFLHVFGRDFSGAEVLTVLDARDLNSIAPLAVVGVEPGPRGQARVDGDVLWVSRTGMMAAWDVSDPASPLLHDEVDVGGSAPAEYWDRYADLLFVGGTGTQVLDVSDLNALFAGPSNASPPLVAPAIRDNVLAQVAFSETEQRDVVRLYDLANTPPTPIADGRAALHEPGAMVALTDGFLIAEEWVGRQEVTFFPWDLAFDDTHGVSYPPEMVGTITEIGRFRNGGFMTGAVAGVGVVETFDSDGYRRNQWSAADVRVHDGDTDAEIMWVAVELVGEFTGVVALDMTA